MDTNRIVTGDCLQELQELDENSVHAIVTDPPYALGDSGFMGRDWDNFSDSRAYQEWCMEWAQECLRVLKPGGHLLAFGGNTRHHRLNCGVEDAGFEIRDCLTWHFGSGFPKASDISKTIDKRADAEREVVGDKYDKPGYSEGATADPSNTYQGGVSGELNNGPEKAQITEPATEKAKEWDGFKTGLKPSTEYIVMARKPFDGATVDCVLEHGTGALNVDACRVDVEDRETYESHAKNRLDNNDRGEKENTYSGNTESMSKDLEKGRYPSNVIFDEHEAERLDREVGEKQSGKLEPHHDLDKDKANNTKKYGDVSDEVYNKIEGVTYGDKGGVSRYFYTSKASKAERTENGSIENTHPTVKPQDLMEWLIKLVTAENQIVLDPFTGSGTTCKAAKSLNREFLGIEKQDKWADVARVRCNLTPENPDVVRGDDNQQGLEAFSD